MAGARGSVVTEGQKAWCAAVSQAYAYYKGKVQTQGFREFSNIKKILLGKASGTSGLEPLSPFPLSPSPDVNRIYGNFSDLGIEAGNWRGSGYVARHQAARWNEKL